MRQLIIAAAKAGLGDDYERLRADVFRWQDIWANRLKNVGYRLSGARPLDLNSEKLFRIKRTNRETCRSMLPWYSSALFENSVCNYGISPDKIHLLDVEIGQETTLSDVICYHCAELPSPVRYLEIGVSVGKNFMQMLNGAAEGTFVGFDIENMNPAIARDMKLVGREEWPHLDPVAAQMASGAEFVRRSPTILEVFEDKTRKKNISYLAGDVFDERCWRVLARESYNLIFSDALHTGAAIKHEYKMMKKYELFSRDRLCIIWDDLHFPGMRNAFLEITDDLRRLFGTERSSRAMHLVYGWAGRREGFRHLIGIFHCRP